MTVKVKVSQSCPPLFEPIDYIVHGILQARILEWVASSLLQGIFPTQGSNPGPLHCGRILYQLSHQESPRIIIFLIVIRKNNTEFKEKGLMSVT